MGIVDGFNKVMLKFFKSRNQRVVEGLLPNVAKINALEPEMQKLSDEQLRGKTDEFRDRLTSGETVDDVLVEAFAAARESSFRFLRTAQGVAMRPFDCQLIGGMVMNNGGIAEMMTGEGKTLVATLPAYLNALPAQGVHVVTVNDYLARRDADWMRPVFEGLGMTVGAIQSDMDSAERLEQYSCDVTYGTNNEFGFDYLRDNMKIRPDDQCQRRRHYAIVDEVDSILIDEARTPLIISGPAEKATDKYQAADSAARRLQKGRDFEVKEKEHSVILTEDGIENAEKLIGVDSFYTPANMGWPHHIEQALKAHNLYNADVDYVVRDGQVIIVDEFTGRLMDGRRWSDGLHQAVEVKEGLRIKDETQTLATITFQNFFRLYDKLGGMTGTAMTEAGEFAEIYDLDVVAIPTNKPIARQDMSDVVYRTKKEKWFAIADRIREVRDNGQPVLVGTVSIEASEVLSEMLKRRGVTHSVLNAKHHEKEAEIITNAGQAGNVTIATNMAGRGTDIVLGEGVTEAGGLFVLGSERHESRRIDNQLRGRCGRQGDPGATQFFLSLEDDLMRVFASERVSGILKRFGMSEGVDITHPMVTRAIQRAQKKVEARNFDIRKSLLEYDEVMDHQRKLIYGIRDRILIADDLPGLMLKHVGDVAEEQVALHTTENRQELRTDDLIEWFKKHYGMEVDCSGLGPDDTGTICDRVEEAYGAVLRQKREEVGGEPLDRVLHYVLLQTLDEKWKEQLHTMDLLRSGIGMRAYAQVDPKIAYKREGYELFSSMLYTFKEETTSLVPRVRVQINESEAERELSSRWSDASLSGGDVEGQFAAHGERMQEGISGSQQQGKTAVQPIRNKEDKVGRNDPCPCGSGKKYKKCHGAAQ